MGGADYVTGVNNIQYTAQFGNGVSATIGLDDPTVYSRTNLLNLGALATTAGFTTAAGALQPTAAGVNAYGGTHAPDIVGNVRVDQAWGLFQISGMAHLVNASYNILGAGGAPTALSEISGHPEDKWGGAVMAALQIKNLPTGPGDDFKVDVSYAKGVTKQVISTSGGSPSFAMFGGTDRPGAYQSIGFGQTADAVYLPGVSYRLRNRRYQAGGFMGYPWCVQPQLGSLLVVQPVRQLRPGAVWWQCNRHPHRQGSVVRELQLRQGRVCRL